MKKLIILCSLIFLSMVSSMALANSTIPSANDVVEVEINQQKNSVEQLYYNFGIIPVNMRSWVTYNVNNTGAYPLYLQNAYIQGGGGQFGARHNCRVLYPGQRCSFTLEFMPFYEGFHVADFVLAFDQAMIRVRMSGHAVRR